MISVSLEVDNENLDFLRDTSYRGNIQKFVGRLGVLKRIGHETVRIAKDRLAGVYGSEFSHRYFHEELGVWVRRYKIKHLQTGRLRNSIKFQPVNASEGLIISDIYYADDVAMIDRREIGEDFLQFAANKINEKILNGSLMF